MRRPPELRELRRQPTGDGEAMSRPHDVDTSLPWDRVTRAVAQGVVQHLPEATATEAYYHLVTRHIAQVLWELGAGDEAIQALNAVLSKAVNAVRTRLLDASAATRTQP